MTWSFHLYSLTIHILAPRQAPLYKTKIPILPSILLVGYHNIIQHLLGVLACIYLSKNPCTTLGKFINYFGTIIVNKVLFTSCS